MLTLFALPKAFRGHIEIIQRNALESWTRLEPRPEIILFGDDEGVAQAAREFGVRHEPQIARNAYGTPLVSDLFARAQALASHPALCYVNADILLMSDFMRAVRRLNAHQRVRPRLRFLMVGQRWNVDIAHHWDFSAGWEARLRHLAWTEGELFDLAAIDYFVFSRGLWPTIPPFAIGRLAWDNWLLFGARQRSAMLVDATPAVMAVHQNHDYGHIRPETVAGEALAQGSAVRTGAILDAMNSLRRTREAEENHRLTQNIPMVLSVLDATHCLSKRGLKRVWKPARVKQWVLAAPYFHPRLKPLYALLKAPISLARSLARSAISLWK